MIEKYVIRKEDKYWTEQYRTFHELKHATLYSSEKEAQDAIYRADDLQWMFERVTIDKLYVNE